VISFFGIVELATQLEEPFSILPIENLAKRIRMMADATIGWYVDEESSPRKQTFKSEFNVDGPPISKDQKISTNGWDENSI
jgi:hypothetical protein